MAILATIAAGDAATGGNLSGWMGGILGGGGASSDAEKAARALSGQFIAAGPYSPGQVFASLQAGGRGEVDKLITAVELKDFMRPGRKTWPGPWTQDLLANAAVFFAHGGVDGNVVKNEKKIRDAVRALVGRYPATSIPSPVPVTAPLPTIEPPYGGDYTTDAATYPAATPNYLPATDPAATLPQFVATLPGIQELQTIPVYVYGLGALLVVVAVLALQKG